MMIGAFGKTHQCTGLAEPAPRQLFMFGLFASSLSLRHTRTIHIMASLLGTRNFFGLMSNRPQLFCLPACNDSAWVRPPESFKDDLTDEARADQESKRSAPEVQHILDLFWSTALGVAWFPAPSEPDGNSVDAITSRFNRERTLPKAAYISFKHRLYMALYLIYESVDAQHIAEKEFVRDAGAADALGISKPAFESALFDVAQGWSVGQTSSEISLFLWHLFCHIADGRPPELCTWKDEIVHFAGYRFGEHSAWGTVVIPGARKEPEPKPLRIVPRMAPGVSSTLPSQPPALGPAAWRRVARGGPGGLRGATPRASVGNASPTAPAATQARSRPRTVLEREATVLEMALLNQSGNAAPSQHQQAAGAAH